jgi:hypothetical protein
LKVISLEFPSKKMLYITGFSAYVADIPGEVIIIQPIGE